MLAPVKVPGMGWTLLERPATRCYSHIPRHRRGRGASTSTVERNILGPKIEPIKPKKPSFLKRVFNYFAKRG